MSLSRALCLPLSILPLAACNVSTVLDDTATSSDTAAVACGDLADRPANRPPLFVNEFKAYDPDTQDWIEIYNCGTETVSLAGVSLWAEDRESQVAWEFPGDTSIVPGGFRVVECTGADTEGLIASFRIAREGGTIHLYLSEYGLSGSIDHVDYTYQQEGHSLARQIDGSAPWVYADEPTPGRSNHD